MTIEINYEGSQSEAIKAEMALNKLAKNVSLENLVFLADLSTKKGINESLQKNKLKIKLAL